MHMTSPHTEVHASEEQLQRLTGITTEGLNAIALEALIVRLYALGHLTSSEGAQFLGISRWAFLDLLGTYHVSIFDETADLGSEASVE